MKFKLGDISTIKGGKRLPKGEKLQEIRNNHPYLRIVDFDGFDFNKRNLQYVPNNVFEKIQKYTISKDDIFLSIVGTIGIVALIGDELDRASLTENAVKITVSNQVNKNYLYYFLQSQLGQEQINSLSVGSTQKKLPIKNIKKIEINLPSLAVQKGIAHKLRILDEKIKLNRKINDNLLKQLKLSFNNLYLSLTDDKTFTLGELIFENISGDWGKAQSQGDFTNRVTIIRGADIDDLALGNSAKTPIRYIKNRALVNKHLLPNDVLVEISGGSPTQSTGRSLLVSDSVIDKFSSEVLGTNFTRIFRPSSEENSILFKSYLDFLYDKDVFFNYENGTTGIKNLDYKSVLKIQLPDIRKANNYQQYINLYKLYNNTVQSNGRQSVQLTKIRQAMLNNFF